MFLHLGCFTHRIIRNHEFLRRANGARLLRLHRATMAGRTAVQCDLADFETRSQETFRIGTEASTLKE